MAKVKYFRLDDRLIHGQIIASWLTVIPAKTIVVADDKAAGDKLQSSMLKMACPTTVKLQILTIKDAAEFLKSKDSLDNVFLICGKIDSAIQLLDEGVDYDELNVGNLASAPGRVKYTKAIWLTPEEKEKIASLSGRGIKLISQVIPSEKASDLMQLIK